MNLLVVIDMQNDFITGALGSPAAQGIVDKVVNKVENWQGEVLFTRDTHDENYLGTQEGKKLPVVHCVKGTEGWEICAPLQPYVKNPPYDKETFGGNEISSHVAELVENAPEKEVSITLVGLCTDICVVSNAFLLKPAFPEAKIMVDSQCCAGVTVESHQKALDVMSACQIEILS